MLRTGAGAYYRQAGKRIIKAVLQFPLRREKDSLAGFYFILFLHTENSVYYCGEGVFGFIIKERIQRRWGVSDAGI